MKCFEQSDRVRMRRVRKKPMIIVPSELYGDIYYRFSKRSGLEKIEETETNIRNRYRLTDSLEDFLK